MPSNITKNCPKFLKHLALVSFPIVAKKKKKVCPPFFCTTFLNGMAGPGMVVLHLNIASGEILYAELG